MYSIDFGDGSWTVPGYDKPITASIKGSQAKGVQDMEYTSGAVLLLIIIVVIISKKKLSVTSHVF